MTARESTVYLRNKRPNTVVLRYGELRIPLAHRGGLGKDLRNSPGDSCALPADALNDPVITRWLQNGTLEKISKDAYMKLGQRTVDVLPNEYLKRPVRNGRETELPMRKADADTTGSLSVVHDTDVARVVKGTLRSEWAGDLMSTDEEIDEFGYDTQTEQANYPSRHRDND